MRLAVEFIVRQYLFFSQGAIQIRFPFRALVFLLVRRRRTNALAPQHHLADNLLRCCHLSHDRFQIHLRNRQPLRRRPLTYAQRCVLVHYSQTRRGVVEHKHYLHDLLHALLTSFVTSTVMFYSSSSFFFFFFFLCAYCYAWYSVRLFEW